MSVRSPKEYLAIEVTTAPPQKLQLMLIDGAIRSLQLAKQFWKEQQEEAAGERIVRGQEIIGQLLAGLNLHGGEPLVQRVAAVYTFLMRSLMEAHLKRDETKLNDVLRVLEIERGTWQEVCRELGAQKPVGATNSPHFKASLPNSPTERFSLEA